MDNLTFLTVIVLLPLIITIYSLTMNSNQVYTSINNELVRIRNKVKNLNLDTYLIKKNLKELKSNKEWEIKIFCDVLDEKGMYSPNNLLNPNKMISFIEYIFLIGYMLFIFTMVSYIFSFFLFHLLHNEFTQLMDLYEHLVLPLYTGIFFSIFYYIKKLDTRNLRNLSFTERGNLTDDLKIYAEPLSYINNDILTDYDLLEKLKEISKSSFVAK